MTMVVDLPDGLIRTYSILWVDALETGSRVGLLTDTGAEAEWNVQLADSLAGALGMLQSTPYDVILLNLNLPDSQGLETLLSLLRHHSDLPVVLLADSLDQETELQAVHYGAQDVLSRGRLDRELLQRSLLHSIERQKLVNSFHHASLHDPLTHLANRNLFLTLLQQALEHRHRKPDELFAVLFLDLDDFKRINDLYGHRSGDLVLSELALRLKSSVRSSDVVSRLAGDEFGLLITDLQEPLDVLPVVHRISQLLGKPLGIPGQELSMTASIGVALSDRDSLSAVEMIENADLAMYQAKLKGKATYCIFNQQMHHEKQLLSQLEAGFSGDFDGNGLLRLCYRPLLSAHDGHLYGLETEIQCQGAGWQSTSFDDMLRLAGGSGMLDALNAWFCQEINQQLRQWDKHQAHGWRLFLHLAPEQFKARELCQQLSTLLLAGGLPPERFYLSLKEAVLQHGFAYQDLLPLLKQLRKQGFRLYLEDFGGSYVTLNTLSQLPIDMVKIHFEELAALMPAQAAPDPFLVVSPVIQLARNLGMEVMLDGIRSDQDMSRLQALEAVCAQGPFISPPISGKDVEVWL